MLKEEVMEKRIYYHDTDAGGVVYYGGYLKYLEEARTEFLENKGLTIERLRERGFLYAVRKCTLVYRAPARYGDIILGDAHLKKITAVQMVFDQKIYEKKTNRLLVEAEVTLVSLNPEFKPVPIPEDVRAQICA